MSEYLQAGVACTAGRPRWHRLYLLLGFDVLAVSASLALNHGLGDVRTRTGDARPVLRGAADAPRLRRVELWVAGAVVISAAATVAYGHRLTRQARASEDQRRRYTSELERVNGEQRTALERVAVLEAAVRSAASALLVTDADDRITWVNPAALELAGCGEAALIGKRLAPLPSAGARPTEPSPAGAWDGQVIRCSQAGSAHITEQRIAPVPGSGGAVDHFVAVRRDLTCQRQAEDDLNAAHEELRLILDSITSILVVLDDDGLVCHWNLPAERAFGLAAAQAVGRRFAELELPFDRSPLLSALAACLAEQRDKRLEEVTYKRPDGSPGFFGFTLSPMRGADGAPHGCLVLAREITERKDLEAQLSRAQKLESLGHLAAGIAHEINTPTQFVNDNTSFLKSSLEQLTPLLEACDRLRQAGADAPEARVLVDRLLAAAGRVDVPYTLAELPVAIDDSLCGLERIAGIVRAMREFSHPGSGSKELADVNRCIQSTAIVARNEWKYVATLELQLDPTLPLVPCYPQSLNQVVLNMLVNAAHAIQEARKARRTEELGRITIGTRVAANELEIRISDTGCGIPAAIRGRIFDPFFTTKEVGKGTGQGLAIVHNAVVKKHGGRIALESEVDQGTTFFVYLPLVGAGATSELELAAR